MSQNGLVFVAGTVALAAGLAMRDVSLSLIVIGSVLMVLAVAVSMLPVPARKEPDKQ